MHLVDIHSGVRRLLLRRRSMVALLALAVAPAVAATPGQARPVKPRAAAPPVYELSCAAPRACVVTTSAQPTRASSPDPSPAAATVPQAGSFTWTGTTPSGASASHWSLASNWAGGVAPTGSVAALSFPILSSAACTASPPTGTCYTSANDITGLSTGSVSIDDGAGYDISGNALTIGGGGMTVSTASGGFARPPELQLPITLGANQTWKVDGNNADDQIGFGHAVTGASHTLTIDLEHQTFVGLNSNDVEVGALTITSSDTGFGGSIALEPGTTLNGTDKHTVTLAGSGGAGMFVAGSSTIGPFIASAGASQLGNGQDGTVVLTVAGAATLGNSQHLTMNVVHAGTTAGTDYSQLSAQGNVSVGGNLRLSGSTFIGSGEFCPTLHVGDVDTLITTTGSLSGTFVGIPDGSTVPVGCPNGIQPTVRISYTAHAVTATVLTAGGPVTVTNVVPDAGPTAGGNPVAIHGANYAPGATVKFGSTPATVTSVSPIQINVVAPAHTAGVVDIHVTSGAATSPISRQDLYAFGPPTVTSFTPTSGITGSTVTISGTNFVPKAKVSFGSLGSPKVTFVSTKTLKAVVPNGAMPGKVAVSTNAGKASSSTNFTPTLSITSFSPTSGAVGTLVTINGVGFNASSTVKFNGTSASPVTHVSPIELQVPVPSGATTGPITVTNTASPVGTVTSAKSFTVG